MRGRSAVLLRNIPTLALAFGSVLPIAVLGQDLGRRSQGAGQAYERRFRKLPTTARISISTAPVLELGGSSEDPELELSPQNPFVSIVELSDRRLAVSDFASIRIYSPDGRLLKTLGRRGSGPGEFIQLRGVCRLAGDTILAWDYSDRRISLWTAEGGHQRTIASLGLLVPNPCFEDGTVLTVDLASIQAERSGSTISTQATYTRLAIDGTVVGRYVGVPFAERQVPPVRAVAIASKAGVVAFESSGFRVTKVASHGTRTFALVIDDARETLASEEYRRRITAMGIPDSFDQSQLPVVSEVAVDAQSRLWVRRFLESETWDIFSPELQPLGSVKFPGSPRSRPRLAGFTQCCVAVRRTDSDGGAVVALYEIVER